MNDLELARVIARKFHAGQKYGIHDYMYHLEAVAAKAFQEHDDRLAVIAMLHDVLEDTSCTEAILHALFDKDIVNAVIALTKFDGEPYEFYIMTVRSNPLARKVKMYDSAANMEESMLRGDMKRVLKYSKQIQLLAE
jgi:(p)ppGpp synthase/HD superfamily hydrolase